MSKAQLLRQVKDLTGLYNLERLNAQNFATDLSLTQAALDLEREAGTRVKADRDTLYNGCTELRKEVNSVKLQLQDALRERDGWRAEYEVMQRRMQKMRRNFFEQAALAGELADNSYSTVAPVSNTDSDR